MSRDEYAGLLNHQPEAISSRHGKLLRHLRFVYVQREAPRNDKKRGR